MRTFLPADFVSGYGQDMAITILVILGLGLLQRYFASPSTTTAFIPTIKLPFMVFQLLTDTANFLHKNKYVAYLYSTEPYSRCTRARYGGVYSIRTPGRTTHVIANANAIRHVLRDPQKCFTAFMTPRMFEQVGNLTAGALNPELEAKIFTVITKTFSGRDTPLIIHSYNQLFMRQLNSFKITPAEDKILLTEFVSRSIYSAMSIAFFGPHFPLDTFDDFLEVDNSLLRILAVSWAAPTTARRAQSQMKHRFGTMLDQVGTSFDDAYPGLEIAKLLHHSYLSSSDRAGVILVIMMAMLAALLRTTLWFMAHLLSDVSIMNRLREEIDHVIDSEFGSLDGLISSHPKRINPETFPLLHATLTEVLRLYTLATFVRMAHRDTELVLDEKISVPIKSGDYVVGEGFSVNLCEEDYEDSYAFRLERHLAPSDDQPPSPKPLSPFGAGLHVVSPIHAVVNII